MDELNETQVRCMHCDAWNRSEMQFGNESSFDASRLTGSKQHCNHCGKYTPMNRENMRFARTDGKGGFVGNDTTG